MDHRCLDLIFLAECDDDAGDGGSYTVKGLSSYGSLRTSNATPPALPPLPRAHPRFPDLPLRPLRWCWW